jgi:nickel/cobalt transporter (NiCoT) family protein
MTLITSASAAGRALRDALGNKSDVRSRIAVMFVTLITFNVLAWVVAFIVFGAHPLLLGTALLAYTFGLRHAVDADHISAIDNVTRKLMQQRKRPVAVGFFFSLGHSTVVVALFVAIALAASIVKAKIPGLESVGSLVGTSISAFFLLAIAAINAFVLAEVMQTFRRVQCGESFSDQTLDEFLAHRGFIGRLFRPLLKIVDTSWQMYPVGLLFGLGFDTATEVALLGIAAFEGARGLPLYSILIFPLLFTVGMSLIDTADGVLMLGAYGWAFAKPVRKLYYNMTITLMSILVALLVGGLEALSVVGRHLDASGWLWQQVYAIGDNFGTLGLIIVGVFALSWAVSLITYKLKRFDDLEPRAEEAKMGA